MSRNQRLSFLGIAAVIAVVAVIVLTASGGSDEAEQDSADIAAQATATATPSAEEPQEESTPARTPTPTPRPQPPLLVAGKLAKLRFEEGDTVRFRVRSGKPEHVHIHGYDIMEDVEPGKTANVAFKADITGIFEIEFEDSAEEIAELRVDPK